MEKSYFKDKRVLITGITGFIGRHLDSKLTSLGAQVYGISKHETKNPQNLRTNILNFSTIDNFIQKKRIDICFHLAGEALVESGQKNPYQTFKVNTEGTLNILEIARRHDFSKVIIASSTHVYGKNKLPYFESYTPRPSRPYETSKACTDLIAQSYADTFNLPVLIPRFVNIYGTGDLNFNRLIPKTIHSVINDEPPFMWGGEAIRDYLFIDDVLEAYISLATSKKNFQGASRIFNFGTGNTITVKDLIHRIIDLSGKSLKIKKIPNAREAEIKSQYVSSLKAQKNLGWTAQVSLDEGLTKTYLWYENYFKN